jgi:uncharacterized protein (UPF0333 family)
LKRKTPRGIWALRAVSVAFALVVVIVIGTVGYSAYEDYTAVRAELSGGSQQAVGSAVLQGQSETVSLNITVPNHGLYSLNVTVVCGPQKEAVVCQPSQVVVPPGQQGVLRFRMTVVDLPRFEAAPSQRINGTVIISMEPFASVSIGTDFGGFVSSGGS